MKPKKIVVDSDIIADHITTRQQKSFLRQLSARYFCYTTVFNAIELFAAAQSLNETAAIQDAMDSMKILGIHPKNAKHLAAVVSTAGKDFPALIGGVCLESSLPIVTLRPKKFSRIKQLTVLSPDRLIQLRMKK